MERFQNKNSFCFILISHRYLIFGFLFIMVNKIKKTKLEENEINRIKFLYKRKKSIGRIAKEINRSKSCVFRYIKKFSMKKGNNENEEKRGRKPLLDNHSKKLCEECVKKYLLSETQHGRLVTSVSEIKEVLVKTNLVKSTTSLSGLRKYLKEWNILYKKNIKIPKLSENNKMERVQASSKNLFINYKNIIFTDESIIRLNDCSCKSYNGSTVEVTKSNTGVMVWAGFNYYSYTDLVVFEKSVDSDLYISTLQDNIPKILEKNNKALILQDNSPVHTSRRTFDYINTRGFKVIHHPTLSPDLNPIEKAWGVLKRRLKKVKKNFKDCKALGEAAKKIWTEIMKNDDFRQKLCKRYKDTNLACLYYKGDFVTDANLRSFRKIIK